MYLLKRTGFQSFAICHLEEETSDCIGGWSDAVRITSIDGPSICNDFALSDRTIRKKNVNNSLLGD